MSPRKSKIQEPKADAPTVDVAAHQRRPVHVTELIYSMEPVSVADWLLAAACYISIVLIAFSMLWTAFEQTHDANRRRLLWDCAVGIAVVVLIPVVMGLLSYVLRILAQQGPRRF